MMSVLVTGAATPLGERLVQHLMGDARVKHVLAVDRNVPEEVERLFRGKRCTYVQADLTRSRQLRELIFGPARDHNVEVVVHLSQFQDPYAQGRRVHQANVESTRSILDLSDRHPTIRRVVLRSHAVVYRVSMDLPVLVTEDHPLNLRAAAPQYVRDRVESDLTACARMGLADCEIVVLRTAEAMGPGNGSQLFDYLEAPVTFTPLGFDPMLNVATASDLVQAMQAATFGSGEGVFNIPGFDTLPLSAAIERWGGIAIPAPGFAVSNLYRLRHRLTGSPFRFGLNRQRMHFGLVLDGTRAREVLGYVPKHPVHWPVGGAVKVS